ncbi:MAG: exostosin family protein [Rhizonema sp. PD37]|nr:exostosin family protein [Rhizonema sp. PD37]
MKLKIFSDPGYLPEGSRPNLMLEPFWLEQIEEDLPPWEKRLANYAKISHSLFEMSSLEEADIAVLPFDWVDVTGHSWKDKINKSALDLGIQFAQKVKQAGKPIAIFYSGDISHQKIPIEDAFVFRFCLIGSQRQPKDFIFTILYEDLVQYYLANKLPIRQKQEKPVVGFDGYATQSSLSRKLKEVIRQGAMLASGGSSYKIHEGYNLRYKALKYLNDSPLVEQNFKIRDNMVFYGDTNDSEQKLKLRLEYVQNMVESDYILCCRGWGNSSLRVFETFCFGRIPIFVDTDCVLSYDFKIDWKKYCVWLDEKDLPQIAERVAEFHNNLSNQEFVELQYKCRELWQEWLSYEGFFSNFWRHFPEKSSKEESVETFHEIPLL